MYATGALVTRHFVLFFRLELLFSVPGTGATVQPGMDHANALL
jgi:hypothetical protein